MPTETYKYYRIINQDAASEGGSQLAEKLKSITGFYPDDYIHPVTEEGGEIVNIVVDESEFKNHFSVALVILPIEYKTPTKTEKELENLIKNYGLDNIHFTEIFGQKVLGARRDQFLEDFTSIVEPIPMSCFSISKDLDSIKRALGEDSPTREEIYHCLLWSCLEAIVEAFPEHSIFHVHTEQEHSMDGDLRAIGESYFNKLYGGIEQLSERQRKKFSICKHPHFFSKQALFFSSIADLLAYGGNKLQNKIDKGVPEKKIIKEHKALLSTLNKTFNNLSGMPSKELSGLIASNETC